MNLDKYYDRWTRNGEPRDPNGSVDHEVKMYYLKRTAEEYNLKLFIESGTSHGDGTQAMLPYVDKVVTIEAWREAFDYAHDRFVGDNKVDVLFGDSGALLPNVLEEHTQPALFWLDAHYSGDGTAQLDKETPIVAELKAIAVSGNRDRHAIVIDDARAFGVGGGKVWKDYTPIGELEDTCAHLFPNHGFYTEGDEIFITPV